MYIDDIPDNYRNIVNEKYKIIESDIIIIGGLD